MIFYPESGSKFASAEVPKVSEIKPFQSTEDHLKLVMPAYEPASFYYLVEPNDREYPWIYEAVKKYLDKRYSRWYLPIDPPIQLYFSGFSIHGDTKLYGKFPIEYKRNCCIGYTRFENLNKFCKDEDVILEVKPHERLYYILNLHFLYANQMFEYNMELDYKLWCRQLMLKERLPSIFGNYQSLFVDLANILLSENCFRIGDGQQLYYTDDPAKNNPILVTARLRPYNDISGIYAFIFNHRITLQLEGAPSKLNAYLNSYLRAFSYESLCWGIVLGVSWNSIKSGYKIDSIYLGNNIYLSTNRNFDYAIRCQYEGSEHGKYQF